MTGTILSIRDLHTHFFTSAGIVRAVDGVDLDVRRGEIVGLVGESGSGKTGTAMSIIGLVRPPGRIVSGRILFKGDDLLQKSEREMNRIRGKSIAMVFQDPLTFLNPIMRVGDQIAESLTLHQGLRRAAALKEAVRAMDLVKIRDPESRARDYPHQLSGGMRQRIMIAMAISCKPELLIADEITTALDILTQAEILELLKELNKTLGLSILIVTHDLGVIASLCNKVAVMYAGRIVETADAKHLLTKPDHPYTQALLASVPRLDGSPRSRLQGIDGFPPDPLHFPDGCRFNPRCVYAVEVCRRQSPPTFPRQEGGGTSECWLLDPQKRH